MWHQYATKQVEVAVRKEEGRDKSERGAKSERREVPCYSQNRKPVVS
jgi:hypothetical protein